MKKPLRIVTTITLFCCAWMVTHATESSLVRLRLNNTGIDPDATAIVQSTFNKSTPVFSLQASNLTRGLLYTLTLDGMPIRNFMVGSNGGYRVTYSRPSTSSKPLLDFDPRGKLVAVRQGDVNVLEGRYSGPGEPDNVRVDERTDLGRVRALSNALANARYLVQDDYRRFALALANVTGRNWSIYVDGIQRAQVPEINGTTRIVFDNAGGTAEPLIFDPRGALVEVMRGTNVMFRGRMAAQIRNLNYANPSVRHAFIPSTGAAPQAVAYTRLRVNRDASRDFFIELEDVPAGNYEVYADGIWQGTIQAASNGESTEGKIEFTSKVEDEEEDWLEFNPATAALVVAQGQTTFFGGHLTNSLPWRFSNTPTSIVERLTSTGLDRNASSEARFEIDEQGRRTFQVEIEDVQPGVYELLVGDIHQGTMTAQEVDNQVHAELEFASDSDDATKLPLDFNPRGQTLKIRSAAGVLFSHVFGFGATMGAIAPPMDFELPLFSTGASGGTAEVRFERDDDGERSFKVELEHVPEGEYTLLVGGQYEGSINVVSTPDGNRGELEYEDSPEAGEWPLDFDPLQKVISIGRGGEEFFQRVLAPVR